MRKSNINTALRQWARGISFTIAMGRRQVFTLVAFHLSQDQKRLIGDRHRHMRSFVLSTECLVDRGLVKAHVWGKNGDALRQGYERYDYRELWQLTRAGELVVELLKEAGIYDEVRAELEQSDKLKLRIV
jgi:hypothetical protein